jgi:hypothetical protein
MILISAGILQQENNPTATGNGNYYVVKWFIINTHYFEGVDIFLIRGNQV